MIDTAHMHIWQLFIILIKSPAWQTCDILTYMDTIMVMRLVIADRINL